jgi:hypothetical protein
MASNRVSLVATDESKVYDELTDHNHQTVYHHKKQYVFGKAMGC